MQTGSSETLIGWKNLVNPLSSMGPKGGSVTMDSVLYIALLWFNNLIKYAYLGKRYATVRKQILSILNL
jgi:hypothetical protein